MQEARILINGIAVQIEGMSDFRYTKFGTIQRFNYKGVVYRYCVNSVYEGYFDFNKYLNFIASAPKPPIKSLIPFTFVTAEKDDRIVIRRREISSDFDSVCWRTYSFSHKLGQTYGYYQKINLPPSAELINDPNACVHEWEVAKEFYENFIYKAKANNDANFADLLADIEQCIESIEENIFSVLDPDPDYNEYIVSQRKFWRNSTTYNYKTKKEYEDLLSSMQSFLLYFQSYQKKFKNDRTLVFIYLTFLFEPKSIENLPFDIKMDMLKRVANRAMDNWQIFFNPTDDQSVVVKIAQSIDSQNADRFLRELVDPEGKYTVRETNLFLALYNGLNNSHFGIGKNSLHDFVFTMYQIWAVSSYNPYQNGVFNLTNFQRYTYNQKLGCSPSNDSFWTTIGLEERTLYYDAAPFSLNYTSKEFIGYYLDDFRFYFSSGSSGSDPRDFAYDMRFFKNTFTPSNKILVVDDNYRGSGAKGLVGTYDYYQPVSLLDADQQAALKIAVINGNDQAVIDGHKENINNLVPVFVLKYIDDVGDRSDFFKTIGYFVDIALLFAGGYSLLTKLKYLRTLSGFTEAIVAGSEFGQAAIVTLYISAGADAITFSAATVSFLLKLTENIYKNEPWYQTLVKVITWIEILSAGGSVLADKLLKTSVKNLVDDFEISGWPEQFTTDTRGANVRNVLTSITGVAAEAGTELLNRYKKKVNDQLNKLFKAETKGTFSADVNGFPRHSPEELNEIIELAYSKRATANETAALIHISYREQKLIPTEQLLLQMKYFVNVTKVRGYPAGFTSLEKYEDFCTDIRNEFEVALKELGEKYKGDFSTVKYDLKIQGSVLRKRLPSDPWPPGTDPNGYIGLDAPRDIEFAIVMDEHNFQLFTNELKKIRSLTSGNLKKRITSALIYAKDESGFANSFLGYVKIDGTSARERIWNAGFNHLTGFPSREKIGFKFFKEGARGALEPFLTFKYK